MRIRAYLLPFGVGGVVLSFALPAVPPLWIWPAAALLLGVAAWRVRPVWLLLCTLCGLAYGVWQTQSALAQQWPLARTGSERFTLEVADLPRRDEKRVQFAAKAWDEHGQRFDLLLADYQLRDWPVGSRWQVSARVRPVVGEVNPRGFDREAWALAQGIDGTGSLGKGRQALAAENTWGVQTWRERISLNWQTGGGRGFSDGLNLMRALSIGEQSALPPHWWQVFRPLGLTHLVSISGLHVTMVALLFGFLMKRLLVHLPFAPAKPRLWILAAGVGGALFYAALAGFAVPTQRSVLMLAAFAWAWWRGSRTSPWALWWQALALVLLFDPLAVLGVGLWLSFGLVAALMWASAGRLNGRGWRLAVRAQWAATVWSLVLLGWLFASVPLLSPLVNALAIPWFSWVLTPLALLGTLLPWPPVQWLGAALAEYTLHALAWLAAYAPEWPVAASPWLLMLAACAAAALLLLPRGSGLRPWSVLVLAAFLAYRPEPPPVGRVEVAVLDAGQGLSVWLHTQNHQFLFDTGTPHAAQTAVLPALNALGVRRLDALALSHHDNDHDGGFAAVAAAKKPQTVWAGQPEFYPQAEFCAEGAWTWDSVRFEWLRPSESGGDDNDQSCVLRVVAGGHALLITGDLGQKGEAGLIARYGEALASQILILGHHGSNTASSGAFLNQVSPRYAVASSGYANAYGHPTAAVQNRVRAHGAELLRTDLHGALRFELGGAEIQAGRLKTHRFYWQKKPFD